MVKYIIVTGGVISGVGKGTIVSSIGKLLKSAGKSVTAIKIDPYLNIDAGTISPLDHGETFVLDDGSEVDLDLGNYERFMDTTLTCDNILTTGKVYESVLKAERSGDYLGKTVQVVPHITNEIKNRIRKVSSEVQVCLIELGGTIGDIESAPFVEALRQLRFETSQSDFCLVHVSLLPFVGEHKTKPTQASVKTLQSVGLVPDILVCRSDLSINIEVKEKVSMFCNVPLNFVLGMANCESIHQVPLLLESQGIMECINEIFGTTTRVDLSECRKLTPTVPFTKVCKIGIFGKYDFPDAYVSLYKALQHACFSCGVRCDVELFTSEKMRFSGLDVIIVPGGFGERGTNIKLDVIRYARENKVPFLGICLGFQLAVIEYARNVLGYTSANSDEFIISKKNHGVTDIVVSDNVITTIHTVSNNMGGSMKLGLHETCVLPGTLANKIFGSVQIKERHRHRYEVNLDWVEKLEKRGELVFSGTDMQGVTKTVLELTNHPFFMATQFHPEFKTRPLQPVNIFVDLIKSSIK